MDKTEKQTDSPKKTVSNPIGQSIVWACSLLLKHLDATVNDGAHLSLLGQLQSGGCKNMSNHQTRRETSSHEQYTQRRAFSFLWH